MLFTSSNFLIQVCFVKKKRKYAHFTAEILYLLSVQLRKLAIPTFLSQNIGLFLYISVCGTFLASQYMFTLVQSYVKK